MVARVAPWRESAGIGAAFWHSHPSARRRDCSSRAPTGARLTTRSTPASGANWLGSPRSGTPCRSSCAGGRSESSPILSSRCSRPTSADSGHRARNYIKEVILAHRRALGQKHGVQDVEAFHHIGGGRRSIVEDYIKKNAVPIKSYGPSPPGWTVAVWPDRITITALSDNLDDPRWIQAARGFDPQASWTVIFLAIASAVLGRVTVRTPL
jgi:hypothetical protein